MAARWTRAQAPHHPGRLPAARQAQGRQPVRRAAVRVAAGGCQGQPDRLDDVDDGHHRAHAHPRAAAGVARALHDRAGGARRFGVGGAAGQRGTAVRQQAVPPVVRRARRRPPADGRAGRHERATHDHRRVDGQRRLAGRTADQHPDDGGLRNAESSCPNGQVVEVLRATERVDGGSPDGSTPNHSRRVARNWRPRRRSAPSRQTTSPWARGPPASPRKEPR